MEARRALLGDTLRPEAPRSSVAAQIVVGQHLVISLRTARLQCVASVGPKVDGARGERGSVQPRVRVDDIDQFRVLGTERSHTDRRVEGREGGIQSGDTFQLPLLVRLLLDAATDIAR